MEGGRGGLAKGYWGGRTGEEGQDLEGHSHAPSPTEVQGKKMNTSLSSLPLTHPQWDLGNPCSESHLVRVVTLSFLMGPSSRAALSTFLVASAKQSVRLKMHRVSA